MIIKTTMIAALFTIPLALVGPNNVINSMDSTNLKSQLTQNGFLEKESIKTEITKSVDKEEKDNA